MDIDLSPHIVKTVYEVLTVFCPLDTGNTFRRLKRPPPQAEPHLHGVSNLRVCVITQIPHMTLKHTA